MKKFLVVLVCVGLAYHFKPELFSGITKHFGSGSGAADGEVVLFTFPGCGSYCEDGQALLERKYVNFQHYDVQASEENRKKWESMGGGNPFPVLHVGSTTLHGYDRMEWLHALADVKGLEVFSGSQREALETHFYANGDAKVVMYATEWCPYCKKAREFFADNNISYTEVDVEKSSEGMRYYTALEASGYPLIYVGTKRFGGFGGSIPKDIKREIRNL